MKHISASFSDFFAKLFGRQQQHQGFSQQRGGHSGFKQRGSDQMQKLQLR